MNFSRSAHSENNLSCLSCHSAHHAGERQFLLIKSQTALCYTCHLKVKPQFNMPFHHRVEEGLIQCVDCHNPHGGFINKQLRSAAARDSVCYRCHADKHGPFVFEHQPIKTEGCIDCHSAHGSPNPRLIKTRTSTSFALSATRLPRSAGPREHRTFTARLRNIRPARYVMRQSTGLISTGTF